MIVYTARNAMKNGLIQNTVCLVCTEKSTGINGAGLDGTVCARSHEQPMPQTFTGSVCARIFLIVQSILIIMMRKRSRKIGQVSKGTPEK